MIKKELTFFCSTDGWRPGDRVEVTRLSTAVLWGLGQEMATPVGCRGTLVEGEVPEAMCYYNNKKNATYFLVEWDNAVPSWNAYALQCKSVEELGEEWE